MLTDSGVSVVLYVDVAAQPNTRNPDLGIDVGEVQFLIPSPEPGQLRALSDAISHISRGGGFHWIYLPDVTGQVAAIQEEAFAAATALEREYEKERRSQEKVAQEILSLRTMSGRMPLTEVILNAPQPQPANPSPTDETPWATWRKPNTTFMFYGLHDGTGWMIITHQDQRLIAVPWPFFEGWDRALPERCGKADLELGGVSMDNFTATALYLRDKQKVMRFSTIWQDILNAA
ncbi:hypothetical protein [Polaromonas sp.]|uniref:hypothetical protein n=1 Tax=Polaromonas sp. TaxID=1869339 RepID=UPI0025ED0A3A|nr:hypothetical protein [Polaromonas sp.]